MKKKSFIEVVDSYNTKYFINKTDISYVDMFEGKARFWMKRNLNTTHNMPIDTNLDEGYVRNELEGFEVEIRL